MTLRTGGAFCAVLPQEQWILGDVSDIITQLEGHIWTGIGIVKLDTKLVSKYKS